MLKENDGIINIPIILKGEMPSVIVLVFDSYVCGYNELSSFPSHLTLSSPPSPIRTLLNKSPPIFTCDALSLQCHVLLCMVG